jgi:carbonic anhydrase
MRSHVARTGLQILLTLALAGLPLKAEEPKHKEPTRKLSAAQVWQRLKDGNSRFVADRTLPRKFADRRAQLAGGQHPFAVVLTCSDSRTAPELIFDQGLGDLFVLRVAGNVTDPVVLGSIEFAVSHFPAPLVVVLGHEQCGAVKAVLAGGRLEGNLKALASRVHVGTDLPEDKKAALARGIEANVLFQAKELTRQSDLLRDFVRSGRVQVVTGVYELASGRVRWQAAPARQR